MLKIAIAVTATVLAISSPAAACCDHGWRICKSGPTPAGTVAVAFTANSCAPSATYAVTGGESAQDICLGLKAAFIGLCVAPQQVITPPFSPNGLCEFDCYVESPTCSVMLDAIDCHDCDATTNTTCCGITITPYDQ